MPADPSVLSTGQAALPSYRDTDTLTRDSLIGQKSSVLPPKLLLASSTAELPALKATKGVSRRSLQNCGINAVYWAKGVVPTVELFHGILAGCVVQDDGIGSIRDFSDVEGAIFIFSVSGVLRVATYEALSPEAGMMNSTVGP